MATLENMPLEILEKIALTVAVQDVRAAVSLTLTNSKFRLGVGNAFWRKVCQVLDIEVFKDDSDRQLKSHEKPKPEESGAWKSAFDKFLDQEKSWKTCTRAMYDVFGETKGLEPEVVDREEVRKSEGNEGLIGKYRSKSPEAVGAQIQLSTFASACDEKYLVLCHCWEESHTTTITVWETASGRQVHEGTVDFEVACQDIIVWMGHLVCMPLWPIQVAVAGQLMGEAEIRGYDLSVDAQDFKHPSWRTIVEPDMVPQRLYPNLYKESGALRILKHEDYIVVVLPMVFPFIQQWTIYAFKGITNETRRLTGIERVDSQHAVIIIPDISMQYFSQDQKGGNFVFCFYAASKYTQDVRSVLVTLHLGKVDRTHLQMERVIMCTLGNSLGGRPRETTYNLSATIENIRMYTAAVGSKTRRMSRMNKFVELSFSCSEEKLKDIRSPAVYVIQANGKIGSFIGYATSWYNRQTVPWRYRDNPLMRAGKVYNEDDWYFNEIVSYDIDGTPKMIVLQKFADGMSLFAVADDENLSHLWTVALSETSLNSGDRFYLKQCLGSVAVADCSGAHLFSSGSGKPLGAIVFHSVDRVLPDVDSDDADESFYAQTGLGIWDIKCVGGGERGRKSQGGANSAKNVLLVIHDLERCAPVFYDAYKF